MGNRLLELVRIGVMPAVTIGGFGTLIYMILSGRVAEIPDWFQVLVAGNVGWWFASTKLTNGGPPVP